jgi:RNA polymerase sigma-70 factor
MASLLAIFSEGWSQSGRALAVGESSAPELEAALAKAIEQGRIAWPHLALDDGVFARHLGRCVAAAGPTTKPAEVLNQLAIPDLFLACAAGHGVADAVEVVCGYVETAVRRIGGQQFSGNDVAQILRQRLCVAIDDQPAKILSYLGRATLDRWLTAVAQRTALSLSRTDGAQHRMKQRLAAEAVLSTLDPERRYVKTQHEADFQQALRHALSGLSDRWRTLLRLHVFAGQSLQHLAVVYDVDDSTISRWLAKAQRELLERTAHHMEEKFGVRKDEFPSLARVMASQVDVSIARLLEDDPPVSPPGRK